MESLMMQLALAALGQFGGGGMNGPMLQPRPIFQQPGYYQLRNYLVDFLVNRSGSALPEKDGSPKVIDPSSDELMPDPAPAETNTETTARAVNA